MESIGTPPKARALRALDTDLPLLASRAAIELDRYLAEESIGFNSVSRLSSLLEQSLEQLRPEAPRALFDPATADVMREAIANSYPATEIHTVEHLVAKAREIAGKFPSVATDQPSGKSDIEQLKRFCLALANLAAAYRHSLFGSGPQHPYRKSYAIHS